jgi:hypothetical protein
VPDSLSPPASPPKIPAGAGRSPLPTLSWRSPRGRARRSRSPLAFTLSAASAAIYLLAAVALRSDGRRWWTVGTAACTVELLGVLAIGTWSLLDPSRFPAATVWSGFGSGYGCFPLALPLLGLLYQRSRRRRGPARALALIA